MLYDITIKKIVHLGFNIRRFTVISIQEFQYTCRAVIYSLSRSERGTKRRRQSQPTARRALARSERALQRWLVRRGQVTFFSPRTRVDALPLRSPFISRFTTALTGSSVCRRRAAVCLLCHPPLGADRLHLPQTNRWQRVGRCGGRTGFGRAKYARCWDGAGDRGSGTLVAGEEWGVRYGQGEEGTPGIERILAR